MKKRKLSLLKIDFRVLLILLVLIIGAQLVLTFHSKNAFHSFLVNTQDWYQNFSVKRITNLTSTSLELLVETQMNKKNLDPVQRNMVIKSFDIIFSQHIMEKNSDEICLFIYNNNTFVPVDDGDMLFALMNEEKIVNPPHEKYAYAEKLFNSIKDELINSEKILVVVENENVFNVFTPFTPNGEFVGALYMKVIPNFTAISQEFVNSYNNVSLVYVLTVSLGLVLIYIVFSFTLSAKEKAQQLAYEEHENFIKEKVEREKETTFTRRIYHAYHKAEKVIGFINMDLEVMQNNNLIETKERVKKYSNFIGRVIYDMKYYDPPIHSIINPLFQTEINEVIKFIIDNLFLRIYKTSDIFEFKQEYDLNLPIINVNEYVIWEIIEPLLQNSITHNSDRHITVYVSTEYDKIKQKIIITIADDGKGIAEELLKRDPSGMQTIFHESASTKTMFAGNTGYGCYIAHTLAVKYCGWNINVENLEPAGCKFTIEIPLT